MEKITQGHHGSLSLDMVQDNISKLKQLFPELITEDASGAKIDVDVLKELVGNQVIDGDKERYNFTWHGKAAARRLAQTPSTGTLRPCKEESKDWDTTQNLFIEGDNLEVLKLLQKSYHKKVKMIYIDPPYNTGKDFIYKDNFKDNIANYKKITGQIDDEGNPLKTNPETSGRYHTHWLNMMYPRLRLARNLLKDDGVIFISIDDTELKNLIEICDNVFGSENFIANFIWEKRTNRENRKIVSGRHDYVVCYTKNRDPLIRPINQLPMSEKALANYKNPDNDPLGEWKSDPASAQAGHGTKSQFYVLTAPNGKQHHLQSGRCWVYTQPEMERAIREGRIWFGKDGNGVPRIKTYLHSKERGLTPESIIFAEDASTNEGAKNALKDLFGGISVFETPKPVDLIRLAIQLSCDDGYVLDFFSGSASTAHAVLKQNALDGKKRKFILVQLPEECDELSEAYKAGYKTISEIGIDRIKKAGDKVLQENHDKVDIENIDTGFKVFKLDSSNIKPWDADFVNLEQMILGADDSLKEGRSAEDVLYEILLKYGLDLTLPIEEHILAGKTVHNIGCGALMICLSDEITLDVVNAIGDLKKELQPEVMRVVFKDAGFADPVVKTNAIQVLKQFGIDDVKSI